MTTKQELEAIIRNVRRTVAEERLSRPPASAQEFSDVLYGQCVENAQQLAERLAAETDATIEIAKGGLNLRGEPVPSTYEDAKKVGTVHHWVIVTVDDGQQFHCNLAEEGFARTTGDILIATRKPDAYIDFRLREVVQA